MMNKLIFFVLIPFLLFSQIKDEENERFIKHTVQLYDSFYTLKSKYNVTRRELVLYNPFLKGSIYLHQFDGKEILIPIKKNINKGSSNIKIALLLPFHTDLVDSLFFNNENTNLSEFNSKSSISIDFYRGFLFSIHQYIEKGKQVSLSVFDTYNSVDSTRNLLDSLEDMDLIVGPLYQRNFNIVKDFFYGTNTIVVSPYIKNVNSNYYTDNFFFMECSEVVQLEYLSKYIFENFYDYNISVVSRNDTTSLQDDNFRNAIFSNMDYGMNVKNIMTMSPTIDSIHHELDTIDFKNIIIIPTNHKENVFVIDLISKLHAFKRDTSMVVFCMGDIADQKFSQIPTYELNNLNIHFASNKDYSFDYNNFIIDFHSIFKSDPRDPHLIKGYQCGKYFLELLCNDSNLIDKEFSILGVKYKFSLQENNFNRNEVFDVWYYKDFDIKKAQD